MSTVKRSTSPAYRIASLTPETYITDFKAFTSPASKSTCQG